MPYLNSDLYDALTKAGAGEELARKAAESVTQPDRTSDRLTMLTWAVGLLAAAMLAGFGAVFNRLGALQTQLVEATGERAEIKAQLAEIAARLAGGG